MTSTIVIIQQGVSLVQNLSCTLKELINASPKIWKKLLTFHFLKSELDQYIERFFVQVHASAKNDVLPLLVQWKRVLLLQRRYTIL